MASTRIVRMIWVMLSVWICCMRGQQRRLISIDDDDSEHDSNLDLNLNLDLDRCGNDDEQCQSAAADRSLLNSLLLFLQHAEIEGQGTLPVELEHSATVGDLRRAAAEAYGVKAGRVELHYHGEKWKYDEQPLADTGVGMQATVHIHIIPRNDIDDFLKFIRDSIPDIWPDEQWTAGILPEIKQREQAALQRAETRDNVDFSDVIEYLNSECNEAFKLSLDEENKGKITSIQIGGQRASRRVAMEWRPLDWQFLPEQTRKVELVSLHMAQIDLVGIECANLEELIISRMPGQSRVDLQGIEKCIALRKIEISDNPWLRELDLRPLSGHRSLQRLILTGNARLTASLDVRPLVECHELRLEEVHISPINQVDPAHRKEIDEAFRNAGFTITTDFGRVYFERH